MCVFEVVELQTFDRNNSDIVDMTPGVFVHFLKTFAKLRSVVLVHNLN